MNKRIVLWVVLILIFATIIGTMMVQSNERASNLNIQHQTYHLTL